MTLNAVPSKDPQDFLLNVQSTDEFANSTAPTFKNRLGRVKQTIKGSTDAIAASVEAIESAKNNALNVGIPAAIASVAAINNRAAWSASTIYTAGYPETTKDITLFGGTWYLCVVPHTSSAAFATDSAKWRVYQGVVAADLAGSNGAGLSGYESRTVFDRLKDDTSILDHIPKVEHAAIKVKTSTYDCTSAFEFAFTIARHVKVPSGQYCVTNLIVPDGCSFSGQLSGNANATASYATVIKHIATSASDVIICDAASQTVYRSGGVVDNIAVIPNEFSRYGINFTNPLGARVGNIQGAGYFSGGFLSVKGPLYFEVKTLNYLYTGPLLTPAAVHFRSFDGEIIGTTAIFRRVYVHGHGSDPAKGVYNAFKFDPASCLQTIIEKCITESISGPVFEIGKGNLVWVNDHYIENVPNSNTAIAPIFRVGVTGAAAPNNAYDTSTALHVMNLWGQGYTGGSASNVVLVQSDVAYEINLFRVSIDRVSKLLAGTNSTQRVRLSQVNAPSVMTFQTGLSDYKIELLGGNVFNAVANVVGSQNSGLFSEKTNLPAGSLFNGFQYFSRDKGARGSLEIYNKTTGIWGQAMPALATAPTTGTWSRGDVVFNMFAIAGVRLGWICTGTGSPGTWEPFGQCGMMTSVAATPGFVGQTAVAGGNAYMAVGTASAADWKLLT